jgi:hypothetical protein
MDEEVPNHCIGYEVGWISCAPLGLLIPFGSPGAALRLPPATFSLPLRGRCSVRARWITARLRAGGARASSPGSAKRSPGFRRKQIDSPGGATEKSYLILVPFGHDAAINIRDGKSGAGPQECYLQSRLFLRWISKEWGSAPPDFPGVSLQPWTSRRRFTILNASSPAKPGWLGKQPTAVTVVGKATYARMHRLPATMALIS